MRERLPLPGESSTSRPGGSGSFHDADVRRFTRLTNGFSKKIENLVWAVSLHPTTPAMAAGVADQVWTLREIADTAGLAELEVGRPRRGSLGPSAEYARCGNYSCEEAK